MTVLVTKGFKKLNFACDQILDMFASSIDDKRRIFIKPNIVFPVKARSKEITSTDLVRTLIKSLRERYRDVDIVLGEGVAAGCDPQVNFQTSGYADLSDELNVPLLDLHHEEKITFAWKFGKLELPRVALERTYINLPILKPSSACVISGALKNQKGLLAPNEKKRFHRLGLHDQIAQLNALIQPSLTIMDCSRFFGKHVLLSGNNCGELDATACKYLGIEEPEHVRLSRDAGVFLNGFTIIGEDLCLRKTSIRPKSADYKSLGRLRLWSNPQTCTMCRYLFHDLKRNAFKPNHLSLTIKLLIHSIKGAEIIMGFNPQWRKDYETVICIGECTRRIAKEEGVIHIPGCPPTLNDLKKNLPRS